MWVWDGFSTQMWNKKYGENFTASAYANPQMWCTMHSIFLTRMLGKQVKQVVINLFRRRKTENRPRDNLLHYNSPNLSKNRMITLQLWTYTFGWLKTSHYPTEDHHDKDVLVYSHWQWLIAEFKLNIDVLLLKCQCQKLHIIH